ncbi:ABC transporter ATP-binding protein/permease [Enterococcus cecorum]|uniref:ABC transporter ATP-binding protein n=1 Tax=Enterococcus cecorum TaxID=44008 RepID=UPI00195B6F18|nr:ABC transporter ATP-binding protein [Enterococcus cecorum]MBM6935924.1 ABC transporter ATP-binding protein [Enterococcus cecorum]MCJ0553093.1 ABC transporter ATP-binding protein/permease [Enterococcus cecorum]MCJ0556968.1 ABC transporter ATP-binding protein/permease [Enterococcus cecorum]MCJ0561245.1 ABC transporter ATP-binding protein/permease [Enterococcus cecorum]MCJ0564214.1 ABC transporter ATP-binding protein/permease [Enterococcus cecorum]
MRQGKMNAQSMSAFMPYLRRFRLQNWTALALGILSGIASVLLTYAIGQIIDLMIGLGKVEFSLIYRAIGFFLLLVVINVLGQYFIQRIGNRVAYLSVANLRKDTFLHLNSLPVSYYDRTPHGNIMSRFTNDMDNISAAIQAIYTQVFSGGTIVVISLGMMFYLNVWLTLVVLIATPIIVMSSWVVAKLSQKNFVAQQSILGDMSSFITEMVGNQKIVKAFQHETINQQKFEEMNQILYVKGKNAQFSSAIANPLSRFVDHLAYVAVGCVGGLLAIKHPELVSIGTVSSFTIYSSQFSKPFIELTGLTTQIQSAMAGMERTIELLAQKPLKEEASLTLPPIQGKVEFQHVDFRYVPSQPLIEDFNFTAQPGQTIAIVGKTGAGKSTLVNLLMRFYEVNRGNILIDGVDIAKVKRDELRKNFGMVLQDTWLFDSTLRENLVFGRPDATDEEITDALKKSFMYDFVMRLPQQLDTPLGEKNVKISDGQRQLLTIARTMISNPPMLILDEATSSVDALTERKIQDAFLAMMKGKTSFVIAHRLSTIQSADQILVMDHGQIVEMGTHHQLLQQNGYYAKLYHAQFTQTQI